MRSPFRSLAAALAIALCGTPTTPAEAAPPAPAAPQAARTAAHKPQGASRRARTEPAATARPGRVGKVAAPEKKPEPPPRADSVGPPNDGRLEGGIRLDTTNKPYLRVVPAYNYKDADTRWGLPALVRSIDRAAKAVHKKHPGAVLGVGDLSRKNGGELAHHHSHESGRDADLGFYLVNEKGQPVLRSSFVKVDEKLTAPSVPGSRFDVARNWLFLQNLLLDREARVSHIFVAEPLKHALLTHARSRGVARALYVRAAQVMMQPTGGLPHDDHFHVRISCPPSMTKSCVEIAKNAPSKARLKMAKKGRRGVKTPERRAAPAAAAPAPRRTAEARIENGERSGGIYLSRATKATTGPDVPVSLWALAGASIGRGDAARAEATKTDDGRDEAASDTADVKDAVDEEGAPRITR
ncbi:penicillin-insensitive murein endopeptidase [Polyangium sp. 6x1]|uniref:penicillin-insensitive murein endopeptidase n=1 Tax=Polyangium sp. 6x1 TaxID=3042689 RepID=UPI002482FE64|nr:penicillin-insensitive murein endopeptidase [Polyangium sp. 6x1]MDI1444589.1 penicillin-insensitive murein endopeptidase [Polyangium sp. 6x1]